MPLASSQLSQFVRAHAMIQLLVEMFSPEIRRRILFRSEVLAIPSYVAIRRYSDISSVQTRHCWTWVIDGHYLLSTITLHPQKGALLDFVWFRSPYMIWKADSHLLRDSISRLEAPSFHVTQSHILFPFSPWGKKPLYRVSKKIKRNDMYKSKKDSVTEIRTRVPWEFISYAWKPDILTTGL